MDVEDWRRSLGLGQYEAAFRENAIDGKVLPKLTAEDLKDLGVIIVGHRRMMLSAIEALWSLGCAPALRAHPPPQRGGGGPCAAWGRGQIRERLALPPSTALRAAPPPPFHGGG